MSIFKRIFRIGAAQANSSLDRLEDPVKMSEQGIRDLKKDLNESLKSLAEVKAEAIKSRKELNATQGQAVEYEQKAILLLQRVQSGQLDAVEADRLASASLAKQDQALKQLQNQQQLVASQENSVAKMQQNVSKLKQQIDTWENELKTLKARAKVSQATKKLNKQLANIDSSGTVSLLEKMKEKVAQQEALAESYGDMANTNKSIDDEIDHALLGESTQSDSLLALKAKLGYNNNK